VTNIVKKRHLSVFAPTYKRADCGNHDAKAAIERPIRPSESEMTRYRLIVSPIPLLLCNKTKAQIISSLNSYGDRNQLNPNIPSAIHLEQSLKDHATQISDNVTFADFRTLRCHTAIDGSQVRWCLSSKVT
jgi:hypothetical protein